MSETLNIVLSRHQADIIRTVLYFDVFNYPLTRDELFENTASAISKEEFMLELDKLITDKVLNSSGNFILSAMNGSDGIAKRLRGNEFASRMMPVAYRYSKKIASFPFVRGVFLSGGLSKNYYDERSDIDYFIVTKPHRLWICRSLLILRYKLLPGDKKKFWCTNYFVTSDSLSIPDINNFTGTELAYLIPTVNYPLYRRLLEENKWYQAMYPNKAVAPDANCVATPGTFTKRLGEFLLGGAFGRWLDDRLLGLTLRRWQRKYPEMDLDDFQLQFRSRKNVCKRHTKGFQNKVLKSWKEKQNAYESGFGISLH